jgi:hypothetical protein
MNALCWTRKIGWLYQHICGGCCFLLLQSLLKIGRRLVIQKAVMPQWGRMMGTRKPKRYDDVLWKVVEELRDRNPAVLEVNLGW